MFLNSTINTIYFAVWAKLPTLSTADVDDEKGVTTLEWLGLGMVMIVLLMVFWNYFKTNTEKDLAKPLIDNLKKLITDAFGVKQG